MRIGLVCPYSLSIPGGVQGQVLGLARAMRTLGHDARVLAPCDGPPPEPGVTPLGRSIPTAANGSVAPIAPDPSCALRTIRALRDEEFGVLHLHEPCVPGPCMTAGLVKSAPTIGTFHAAGTSAAYKWAGRQLGYLAKRLDHRCAVSGDARALAAEFLGCDDYELVFNGIEVDRFATAVPTPTDRPTIVFIGRHEPRKGLAVLLEALKSVPDDVRVWVGGQGPQTAELKAAYPDPRVEWLGRLSDPDVASRLAGADVYCAPSLGGESFGVVLLEAMAAGTAIVASGIPGYRNVATHDRDSVLVEPDDPAALADALRMVLADASLRDRLVAAGRARADEFSMVKLAQLYLERYERITG